MAEVKNWSVPANPKNLRVLKTFQPGKFLAPTSTKQLTQQQGQVKPAAVVQECSGLLEVPPGTFGPGYPKQVDNDDQVSWDCSARSVYAPSNRSQREKGEDALDDGPMMIDGSVKDNDDENICKNLYDSEMTDGIDYDIEEDDFDASTFHNYNRSSHNRQCEVPTLNFSSNMLKPQHRNNGMASMSSANYNGAGQMSQGYIRSARNYNEGFDRFSRFSDYHSHYGGSQLDTQEYNNNIEYDGAGAAISTQYEIEAVKPRMVVASQNDFQQKFKTEMCRNFEMTGQCKFGNECTFAHGEFELLRKSHIHSNYRTKECKNFYTNLYCAYGNRCQFYHDEKPEHLRPVPKESYVKSITEIEKLFVRLDNKVQAEMLSLENIIGDSKRMRFDQNEKILDKLQLQIQDQMKDQPLKVFEQIKEVEAPKFTKTKYGFPAKPADRQQSQAANGGTLSGSKKSGFGGTSKGPYSGHPNRKNSNMNINTINSTSSNNNNQSGRKSKAGTTQNHLLSSLSVNSMPHFHPTNTKYQAQQSQKFQGWNQQASNIQTNDSCNQSFYSYNQQQSPSSNLKINFQLPVPQLPHIQQFFPNLAASKPHMNEIKEIFNDGDCIAACGSRKDRTNSMSLAEKIIQHSENDIQQELNKPSNQQVSSFTENMVYTHPVNHSSTNNGNKDQNQIISSFDSKCKHIDYCKQGEDTSEFFNNFDFSIDAVYNQN